MKKTISELIWLPTGGHIGDAVLIMALFGEITKKVPHLNVSYILRRNASFIKELSQACPNVTVISLPYSPLSAVKTILPLLRKKALVMVPPPRDLHPFIVKILSTLFMLRGDTVIGFRDIGIWQPYTVSLKYNRAEKYIDNLREALSHGFLQTEPIGTAPRLAIPFSLPKIFPFSEKPYIVIHPFPHMTKHKTLPLRRWKGLIKELRKQYPSYGLVLTGAEIDRIEAESLKIENDSNIFLAIGFSLLELASIIHKAQLYISIDTGPTHIAGILQTPSIILAQQNEPAWLPTYNPNATLVWEKANCVCGTLGKKCEVTEEGKVYRRCVYDVTDEAVLDAIHAKIPN